ncbi:MAG: VOC family protein [Acidobacteria bacterium]|nr:VOC family protein [Acidobacteriota bacterium]MBV9146624.1 VOC family protein [Acidobacteriota bacterium]MBV9437101.1 VOC family protein [Acidobacteriota bacterium]
MPSTGFVLLASALLSTPLFAASARESSPKPIAVSRITSILYADEVEPCVKFWTERLGFQVTAAVPDGDKVGFAMLQKGAVELMYQSRASAAKDSTSEALKSHPEGASFIYVEVDDLDRTLAAMKDVRLVHPVHTTFYGMREFIVSDPAGHIVIFAQPVAIKN